MQPGRRIPYRDVTLGAMQAYLLVQHFRTTQP